MITMAVEPVCDLSMIKAEYLCPASNDQSSFYGYRIAVTLNGEINARFDVGQDEADKFANELILLQLSFAPIHDTGGHDNVPRGAHKLALIDRPVLENQMVNPMPMWRTWRSLSPQAAWLASEARRAVGLPACRLSLKACRAVNLNASHGG
jgi:hypothetical protein